MNTTSQIAPQPAASKQKDQRTAQEPAPRQPEAHVSRAPSDSALALQRLIGNRAVTRLMQEGAPAPAAAMPLLANGFKGSAAGIGNVQRLPNDADPSSAAPASAPSAASPADASASTPQPGSRPPVVFGMDTTSRRIYASVTVPGHSMAEISTYIYGTPDKAAELQARNGAPAQVQAGRNLELTDATLAPAAQQAINSAQENGTLLRSTGIPTEETSGGQITVYRFTANGQAFELTQAQYQAFLTGQSVYFTRKASYFRDLLKGQLEVRDDHVNQNNRIIRGISDWMGNVEVPPTTNWTEPMGIAQAIIDELASGDITPEKIGQSALHLAIVVKGYTSTSEAWHHYIEGTIAGAERTASDLEGVRDTAFMIEAGLAGAWAVPVVLPLAGSGLAAVGVTGTTSTVLSGATAIGAGALAGGTVRGGLEMAAPNPQNNAGAWDRFFQQAGRGAIAGGIGAAGALATPGVSGAISQRLFGAAPEALTGIGAHTAVGALTGLTIGIPSGALDAAINNVPALASGKISTGEYLEKIGWGTVGGAAFGTVFGAIGEAFSRPRAPSSSLASPEPPAPGVASPDFVINPPPVNPATGEITQTATHLASGEAVQMRFNPGTGEVTMTRISTGEVVTVRQPTSRQLPPGEVTSTSQEGTGSSSTSLSPAKPSPAQVEEAYPPGEGSYKATYGSDPMAQVRFQIEGEGVNVTDVFRGSQPKGGAGSMVADALKNAGIARPKTIRVSQILENQPTLGQLKEGVAPGETVLGNTIVKTVDELGGKVTGWTVGEFRGKTWIQASVAY